MEKIHWSRSFKIKKDGKVYGKVICTSEDYSEFNAEIIITNMEYLSKITINKGIISGITFPSIFIKTKESKELYDLIDIRLNEIFGTGVFRKRLL